MLQFIVLGEIPGTKVQINFGGFMILMQLLLVAVLLTIFVGLRRRQSDATRNSTNDSTGLQQLKLV